MMRARRKRAFESNRLFADVQGVVINCNLAAVAPQSHRVGPLFRPPSQENGGASAGEFERQGGFVFDPVRGAMQLRSDADWIFGEPLSRQIDCVPAVIHQNSAS